MKYYLMLILSACNCCDLFSQQYVAGEMVLIKPYQVIIDNYTGVKLLKETQEKAITPAFDMNNPYTLLQQVSDEKGNNYHILLQTDFLGKLVYLAISNNLSAIFNRKDRPVFFFQKCMKEMSHYVLSAEITAAAVKCIIDRLNYCIADQ